jgi:hypothetical protein
MKARRCFWRDFFDRHDARLVTTVMGSWDTNWMRAIDPAVSGLRAERTSLLSLGDDHCRFAVLETDDPLAGYTDKLEQRFVATQDSGWRRRCPPNGLRKGRRVRTGREGEADRTRAKRGRLGQGALDLLGSPAGAVFPSDPL